MKSDQIAPAPIQYFTLDQLVLSDLNPRQDVDPTGIDLLADSLAIVGLMQNLSGLADAKTGKVGIVAGGRRLRAIARAIERDPAVVERQPTLAQIPVQITFDAETARAWASVENAAREALHPADEIRAYGKMKEAGADVPTIARSFAKTEAHVYRRLALAALPGDVLDALKAGEISLDVAKAFTIAQDSEHALAVLNEIRGRNHSAARVKDALIPDSVSANDRRAIYVGIDAYEAAGGTLTRDLFSDDVALHDAGLLETLFVEKLDMDAEQISEGWKWVRAYTHPYPNYSEEVNWHRIRREGGELSEDQIERYNELLELHDAEVLDEPGQEELAQLETILEGEFTPEQKAIAGLTVYLQDNGKLAVSAAYVRPEDRDEAVAAGVLQDYTPRRDAATAPKSPISAALAEDLRRVAKGAQQHAILRDPDLLLDLLAYQLSHGLAWRKPFGISTEEVPNWPTTEAEGYALNARLTSDAPRDMYGKDLAKSFRAFRKKGPDHVRGELTRFLAAHYKGGDEQIEDMVNKQVSPNVREVWTPTAANFFSRVTGAGYLNDLWRELLDLSEDHPTATTFTKLKKGEKAAKLEALFSDDDTRTALGITEEQAARIDAWLPEGMI